MKFQVPQFIDVETKLIGPLTLKQFLWLASGGAILFFLSLIMNRILFFIVAIPVGGFFAALAFIRVNEAPLMYYVLYAIMFALNPKQYIFKKEEEKELQEIIISDGEN